MSDLSEEMKAILALADALGYTIHADNGGGKVPVGDDLYNRSNSAKEHIITAEKNP